MSAETRLELLKLVHRHGLTPHEVIGYAREYEKFLHEVVPPAPAETKAGGRAVKKGGEPSK